MDKPKLTIPKLIEEARRFCDGESQFQNETLFGITDGKAVGTHIEHKFQERIRSNYTVAIGNSASGIDFPSADVNTDIKVTSIKQPQSSCPFKSAQQKIYGLGYNLLIFVYDKSDDPVSKTATLNFVNCAFIEMGRTADFQMTAALRQMIGNQANAEDIVAYLMDRNLPADEITLQRLAEQILKNSPQQGYLTISNALQWRLQYGRIVTMSERVDGITRIVDKLTAK
jgi:hypothetical protein